MLRRFGTKLGELREKAGLSHRELAERLGGISHTHLFRSENGEVGPINQPTIIKASRVLDGDPVELIELASLDRGYVEIDAFKVSPGARQILCRMAANPKLADRLLRMNWMENEAA